MANIKVRLKKTDGEWLELGKRYISDLSSLSQSTTDPSSIQYGVLANSGSITINDIDGRLAQCVENGEIVSSGLEIEIYSKGTLIQKHILQDADYDKNKKTLSLQLTDEIEKIGGVTTTPQGKSVDGGTLYTLFFSVLNNAGIAQSFIIDLLDKNVYVNKYGGKETLRSRLARISLPYSYNKQSTLNEFLSKVCEVCKLNFHQIDGEYVFSTGRPERFSPSPVVIPRKCLISSPTEQLFLKNSIGKVTYTDYNFKSEIKVIANTTFYTRDNDDNFTIANVPSGEIKTISNEEKLCCFLDVSTSDEYFVPLLYGDGSSTSSPYPFWYGQFNNDGSSQESYVTTVNTNTTNTKDTYTFTSTNCTHLSALKGLNTATFALSNSLPSNYSTKTQKIETKIYANCVSTAPTQVSVGDGAEYVAPDNEYLTQDANWLSSYISNTLGDWGNGVKTTSLDIFCTDLYYEDGTLARNWDNGEVLKVGDTVKLPKDDTLWKVTSREFKWSGSPSISLQLQEITANE